MRFSLTVSTCLSRAYTLGRYCCQTPEDTFFNGKLYVSNQAKAFNTVLVTHLVEDYQPEYSAYKCTSVEIRNENTGSKITLQLVPTIDGEHRHSSATPTRVYYQNYFTVVDRDGTTQVENHNGPPVCTHLAIPWTTHPDDRM